MALTAVRLACSSLSLGCMVGWVLARLLGVPKWLRPHIMCCTASGECLACGSPQFSPCMSHPGIGYCVTPAMDVDADCCRAVRDLANAGNLPLILVAALCSSTSAPAAIAGAVPPGQCAELGIAYIVFAMWVAGLFQFSIVNSLLSPRQEVRHQISAMNQPLTSCTLK